MKSYKEYISEGNNYASVMTLLEDRLTVDVGKIVPVSGGRAAIMINGKPEGNVTTREEKGKKIIVIELFGKTVKVVPSGPGGKLSAQDMTDMKVDVADIYMKHKK